MHSDQNSALKEREQPSLNEPNWRGQFKKKRLLEGQEQIKSKQEELNWECEGREEEHQQGTKKFETQEILMETQAAKSGNWQTRRSVTQ